jgi:preprotein translocase subunit YajC
MLFLAFALLAATAPLQELAAGEIYKWVDAAGKTQYSQFPPPAGTAATEIQPALPPAADSGGTDKRLQQEVRAMDKRLEAGDKAKSDAGIDAEIARITRENCEIAKKNLTELQQGGIKRYRTGEGEVVRLTEEDRQRRIDEANGQIQEFCK